MQLDLIEVDKTLLLTQKVYKIYNRIPLLKAPFFMIGTT